MVAIKTTDERKKKMGEHSQRQPTKKVERSSHWRQPKESDSSGSRGKSSQRNPGKDQAFSMGKGEDKFKSK